MSFQSELGGLNRVLLVKDIAIHTELKILILSNSMLPKINRLSLPLQIQDSMLQKE